MGWFKTRFTSSLSALFSSTTQSPLEAADLRQQTEGIRQAMLALLDGTPQVLLKRRVLYAFEAQDLWYLRGDVMAVLAARLGEEAAAQKVQAITSMFQELLPQAMTAPRGRPGSASRPPSQ